MKANTAPIGFFDSGIGGTSIWSAVTHLLPQESTVYVADSANAPYGEKSPEEIVALSVKNTEFLLDYGAKLIVVACNTATTNAIASLRARYPVPFVGIEPAIKPAALQTKSGKVGLLATKGTLGSALFHKTALENTSGVELIEQEGAGLVPLIEAGFEQGDEVRQLLQTYLKPMLEKGIDTLVLGCTHYPYLKPILKEILPPHLLVLDAAAAVAKQTQTLLTQHELLAGGLGESKHVFFTNKQTALLARFVPAPLQEQVYFTSDF